VDSEDDDYPQSLSVGLYSGRTVMKKIETDTLGSN